MYMYIYSRAQENIKTASKGHTKKKKKPQAVQHSGTQLSHAYTTYQDFLRNLKYETQRMCH